MNLILFNGPPRSGKDTASLMVEEYLRDSNPVHEKFSWPSKAAFSAIMHKEMDVDFNVEYYEVNKEEVIPTLGVSFRQWQIDFSERFMKPCYGEDVFARLLVERAINLHKKPLWTIVSDCGFQVELNHVARLGCFDNILLVRLHRDKCSFAGDSREHVFIEHSRFRQAIAAVDVFNNSSLVDLRRILISHIKETFK